MGNGNKIKRGIDPIVGTLCTYLLPLDLREYLADLDIVTLAQAHNAQPDARHYWFTAKSHDSANLNLEVRNSPNLKEKKKSNHIRRI